MKYIKLEIIDNDNKGHSLTLAEGISNIEEMEKILMDFSKNIYNKETK